MISFIFSLFVATEVLYLLSKIHTDSVEIDNTRISYRPNDLIVNECEYSVEMLSSLTNPMTEPWFVELSGMIEKDILTITVIMNVKVMKNRNVINHFNYSVLINGEWYSNRNRRHKADDVLLQRYSIPLSEIDLRRLNMDLRDNKNGIVYKNLPICIRKKSNPVDMGVCTHVSAFNSIPEIASWVVFHLSQGMDRIIIMISTPYPELNELFDEEIRNGKVILQHFEWPFRRGACSQRQYQVASMTTCFHRYRHSVKTLFFVDVDEYIHSVASPFNYKTIVSSLIESGYAHASVRK